MGTFHLCHKFNSSDANFSDHLKIDYYYRQLAQVCRKPEALIALCESLIFCSSVVPYNRLASIARLFSFDNFCMTDYLAVVSVKKL